MDTIKCGKCKKAFHRSQLKISGTNRWLSGHCPECGTFLKCLPWSEVTTTCLGDLTLKERYIGADVKNVTVTGINVDYTAQVENIEANPVIRQFFNMSGLMASTPSDTALRIAEIICGNIKDEFGGLSDDTLKNKIIASLTRDKSEDLPFLRRARELAKSAASCGHAANVA